MRLKYLRVSPKTIYVYVYREYNNLVVSEVKVGAFTRTRNKLTGKTEIVGNYCDIDLPSSVFYEYDDLVRLIHNMITDYLLKAGLTLEDTINLYEKSLDRGTGNLLPTYKEIEHNV